MARNKLTPEDLKIVHSGYVMRLSAADTCQVLNQSRDPENPIAPSTVSYQYTKFRAGGVRRKPPKDVLELADFPQYLGVMYEHKQDQPAQSPSTPPTLDTAQTTPTSALDLDLALDQAGEFK